MSQQSATAKQLCSNPIVHDPVCLAHNAAVHEQLWAMDHTEEQISRLRQGVKEELSLDLPEPSAGVSAAGK